MVIDSPKTRASLARRQKRLMIALNSLLENDVINLAEFRLRRSRVDGLIELWKREMKLARGDLKRGRPRIAEPRSDIPCKKSGCTKPAIIGQVYCSRDCAPFGNYGVEKEC